MPNVCILICGPCVSQDVAGSTRQGHKGIQFSGGLSQPTQNIKNNRRPFVSHSPIRLSTVQTPITTTPPPAPHAIPSSGGQQIKDGRLVLEGGVQGFGAPSCKDSGAEARIGSSIEAPGDGGGGRPRRRMLRRMRRRSTRRNYLVYLSDSFCECEIVSEF